MRAIPAELDAAVVAAVDDRLDGVAREHGVHLLWAIESGSRAWGFPSPDSDYDCRFLYVRPRDDYLSLWPPRDVIETPLDRVFDVNGWDLAKAVRLLAKGNAVVVEWLRSPIVYRGDDAFRDRMLVLAAEVAERDLVARHYLHVARQQSTGSGSLKRFFYALRPAVALRWLHVHPDSAMPPMDLPTLLAESNVGSDVEDAAIRLIAAKSVTRELGTGTPPDILVRFVADEIDRAAPFDSPGARTIDDARGRADAWFRAELARL